MLRIDGIIGPVLSLDTENIIFVSKVIRVTVRVSIANNPEGDAEVKVFDTDGQDITDKVRSFTITQQLGFPFKHATLELNMPGFDGPFCTPAVDAMLAV